MDTPGLDVESVTGMVGGGAQVVVFTTGLGTPTGNPIAPVIKITGNARTAQTMADNIDLDVSGVLDDTETLDGGRGSAVRRSARRSRRAGRPRPSGSATASSRFIAATRRSEDRRRWRCRHDAATVAAPAGARRKVPLDDLRPAVPRRDDQLRRSPGDRHPQADAAGAVRLDRDRLRRHRLRLPAGVRDRISVRRPRHGPARHQARVRARADRSGRSPRWRPPRRRASARRRRCCSARSA